jgi:hypothetical protein
LTVGALRKIAAGNANSIGVVLAQLLIVRFSEGIE